MAEWRGEDDELPPPPEEKDLLLLLEILVDTLKLNEANLSIDQVDPCTLKGQTCIAVKFLQYPPMHICERDFDPNKRGARNEIVFNAGKSIIFGMKEGLFEDSQAGVTLYLEARKKLAHGCKPEKVPLGLLNVDMKKLFQEVFTKFDDHPEKLPVSSSMKDTYQLKNNDGLVSGVMDMYIRLTCIGQNVVTEFQKGKPFVFKNRESTKVYECVEKHIELGKPCPGQGKPPPRPDPNDDDYEDITVEVNGNALALKVEKSRRKKKAPMYDVSEFCNCPIPLPKELVGGQGSSPSDDTFSAASPLQAASMSRGASVSTGLPDGAVGVGSNNQIVFQVPQNAKLARPNILPVLYNVNTCEEMELHEHGDNRYRIQPETNKKEPPTSEKDLFVVKIMKRGKSDSGRANLNLEFRTPKEPIAPPTYPVYMVEKEVQPQKAKGK